MILRCVAFMLLMTACTQLSVPAQMKPVKPRYSEESCLAWVIHSEARGEPLRGQRAVLDVVLHRMKVRNKTACEVVMEPRQFSGYKRGSALKVTHEMLDRLDNVRKVKPVAPKAEYFHATYVRPPWATRMKRKIKIGLHIFYEKKPKQKEKQK